MAGTGLQTQVEIHKYRKVPPSRTRGQDVSHTHPAFSLRESNDRSDPQLNHVWITKFVKLPKDTAGSFIMTLHTDVVADLLGVWKNPIPLSGSTAKLALELSSQWVG